MPVRKSAEPLVKVTFNLYAKDYEKLKELFPELGASNAMRTILSRYLENLERESASRMEELAL